MFHVEIVLKVAERCNLNCTYCYFFNKENQDYENNPALISTETVQNLVRFLRTAHEISETIFQIDIHGGEPLLLGVKRFSEIVSTIKDGLRDARGVRFAVQTNAVLINQAWLEVFARYQIAVGISVDGPKFQHDAHRVDRRGRGTFDRMVPKIAAVKQAVDEGRLPGLGSICVLSPESDGQSTYRCLTQELGFSQIQFLFPDDTHNSTNPADIGQFVKLAGDLFECWENDANRSIRIKHIDRVLQGILNNNLDTVRGRVAEGLVFTISSAGDLGHDDTLRNTVPAQFNSGMNVANATFSDFISWYTRASQNIVPQSLSSKCASCTWSTICEHATVGETPLYRMKNGIADQPSIYCEALKTTYLKCAAYLAKRGVPIGEISKNMNPVGTHFS